MVPQRPLDTQFDLDTAVRRIDGNLFEGHAGAAWWIERGPNGGYLASILLNALTKAVDDPDRAPRSLTVHYLRPAKEGPLHVETNIERGGRSLTTLSARMHQEGEPIAVALASFSNPWDGIEYQDASMPEVPSPDELGELVTPPGSLPRFAGNFDYRWAVNDFPFTGGSRARAGAWMRLKEPRNIDGLLVTTMADGCPPSVFARLDRPIPAPRSISRSISGRRSRGRRLLGENGYWACSCRGSARTDSSRKTERSGAETGSFSLNRASSPCWVPRRDRIPRHRARRSGR
jgi:hypothetical protein